MQKMGSVLALQPNFSDAKSKFVQDFWLKLKLMEDQEEDAQQHQEEEVKLQSHAAEEEEENRDGDDELLELDAEIDDEEEEDEDDFSFSRAFGDDSLTSAEEAFLNGQIRPIFPLFNQDLLLPNAAPTVQPEGPFCGWRGKAAAVVGASPDVCKKSNSTGFSKLRRFRELVLRSNSDGKDKFAFLPHHHHGGHNNPEASCKAQKEEGRGDKVPAKKTATTSKKKKKVETSAFEKIYARRKQQEKSGKRVSYLPYKQVGFFASVNGLSKNVHPY